VIEPADSFYGDRVACVKDVAENHWWIATRIANPTIAETQERATAFFKGMSKPAH
jgi:hypothetical protein